LELMDSRPCRMLVVRSAVSFSGKGLRGVRASLDMVDVGTSGSGPRGAHPARLDEHAAPRVAAVAMEDGMRISTVSTAAALLLVAACDGGSPVAPEPDSRTVGQETPAAASSETDPQPLPTGDVTELTILQLAAGDGPVAEPGDRISVHYTGWLYDPGAEDRRGAEFDSSRARSQPFTFQLGAVQVIRGWDEGVAGMEVGGRRLLFIPPDYAYGERGAGGGAIPPNSTLVFDVELLEVLE